MTIDILKEHGKIKLQNYTTGSLSGAMKHNFTY